MRAACIERLGETPVVAEIVEPVASAGRTVVPVRAAALNPLDLHLGMGRYGDQPTPHVIGREGVAEIDGCRRYFTADPLPAGSIAERVALDATATFAIPDGLSDEQAIAVGSAGITALLALEGAAGLRPGESVLVLGASGAVGQLAVQLARSSGAARVVGAARNVDALSSLALDAVVALDDQASVTLPAAAAGGFDVVIDPVGGDPLASAIAATAEGARIVTLGISAGRVAPIDTRALQGRSLLGFTVRTASVAAKRAAYARLVEQALAGAIHLRTESFPLDAIARAWVLQEASPNRKLIIQLAST
jgi:NADPH2:quinone reductase